MAKKAKKPIDCPRCQSELEQMPVPHAEFTHILQHLGQKPAAVYMNSLLTTYHKNHS